MADHLIHDDYTIAWIAVLPIEAEVALGMLDKQHQGQFESVRGDDYIYIGGEINGHNVVVATWPAGQNYGVGAAAALVNQVKARFTNIWFALLVGVAAGIPNLAPKDPRQRRDIRLGDVLVCVPDKANGGIVHYDLGKDTEAGFLLNGRQAETPAIVRAAIGNIQLTKKKPYKKGNEFARCLDAFLQADEDDTFQCPSQDTDQLFTSSVDMTAPPTPIPREPRDETERTRVWYGNIGSGNSMTRNARRRDELRDTYDLIGLEMEAAGIMNTLPTGVVRGVCDYGDGQKNKDWQPYAAAVAAVYAKGILSTINPKVAQIQRGVLPSTGHAHWTVTRSTNTLFTGRYDILHELENIARDAIKDPSRQEQCRIVISGIGGQGKSEICLQLAHRIRRSFWGVFWIDVSTAYLAETGFLDVASRLHIPAQTLEDARQGLANINKSWLLVLDNADDPHVDYQYYFPSGPSGVVMLTSRNDECHQYATEKYIALDGLAEAEAQGLLLRAAHVPHDQHWALKDDAQKVASLLRSHPLALIQAGSYVARGHCTLAEYPQVYVQQRKRLLAFRPNQAWSRYRDVYATFEASAEILQSSRTELSGDALQLLPVLAICGPSRLPLPLFEAAWRSAQTISPSKAGTDDADRLTPWHVSRLPSFIQIDTDIWDSFRLIEAIHLLKSFSLVSTDTYNGFLSVSMHPLIHAWARDRLDPTEQHGSWVTTGCLVVVSSDDHVLWRKHGRQLQPHLQALLSWEISRMFTSEPPVMITCILVKCGWLLREMRDDAKLFALMNNLSTYLSLNRLTVDEKWLPVYDLTARNLVNYGKVREAVSLLEQVVKIREQTLAEDHPDRLASQHALAIAYQANGQVKEAVLLLEQVVKIREQTLAEDHPSRLASQYTLAITYRANGQVKEAVLLLEQVVKIEEQTLAEDHPDRLASQHTLAIAYKANRQVKEALLLLEQVVKIEEQTLAEDHPDRLASQHALAGAYEANGQVKEAVLLLEQVVKIKEQTLAEDHPSRLASQHVLAGAYEANGQVKEAMLLLEQVVKIKEQTLAEDHPDRLASQHALAIAYQANGQVKEAVLLLEQVVKIKEQTLAEDHPDRLASQHTLAIAYKANRQVKEALLLLEQVVKIKKQTLAEDHPSRLASQHELARAYGANGQVKEAVSLLEQVVKIREQTLAEDHPSRLASQQALATMFWDLGRRNASLQIMKHVVEIQRQVLDKHHPDRKNSEAWLEYFEDEMCNVEPA